MPLSIQAPLPWTAAARLAAQRTLAMAEPSALLTARFATLTGRHTLSPRPSGRTSSCRNLPAHMHPQGQQKVGVVGRDESW